MKMRAFSLVNGLSNSEPQLIKQFHPIIEWSLLITDYHQDCTLSTQVTSLKSPRKKGIERTCSKQELSVASGGGSNGATQSFTSQTRMKTLESRVRQTTAVVRWRRGSLFRTSARSERCSRQGVHVDVLFHSRVIALVEHTHVSGPGPMRLTP